MASNNIWNNENLIKALKSGDIAVMPTDTLYGIVGKAENGETVNRIYELRRRAPNKPCIMLIADVNELEKFSVSLSEKQKDAVKKYWTNSSDPTSIVLECLDKKFEYLHRGTKTLAFRLPAQKELRDLILKTGPLVAPSANLEGLPPAKNITEAQKYFGDFVDIYIDGGEIGGKASKVIELRKDGSALILRK